MADEYDLEELIERPYKKPVDNHRYERSRLDVEYGSSRYREQDYEEKSFSEEDEREMYEVRKHKHKHKKSHKSKHEERKKRKKREYEMEEYENEDEEDDYGEMIREHRPRSKRERHKRKMERSSSEESDYEGETKRRRSDSSSLRRFERSPRRYKYSPRRSVERSRERMRSRERVRERSRERRRSSDRRSKEKRRERSRSRSNETPATEAPALNDEEKDARTVFCMQLSTRLRPIDLKDFFGKLGKIRDVRLIMDNRSRRSKGIAYIEFHELSSAVKALEMNGQRLLGVPIIVQPSHGERNRSNVPITTATGKPGSTGPMKLYVGSLHYNITEDMLRTIFEPFGPLDELKLMKDHITGKSAGYGFLQFHKYEDGKKALDQLNGYEIAGRPMKLGSVAEYQMAQGNPSNLFDADEVDKVGFGMSATSRIQLMAKLAEGTGFEIPKAAANVLNTGAPASGANKGAVSPPIATQCFLLSNMFTSKETKDAEWERELRDEVLEECTKHGGVLHLHIDRSSPQGHIYIKCPTIASAMASVNTLHGRFFAGRQITAAYVPLPSYHSLFPDSIKASRLILPSTASSSSSLPYNY